MNERWKDVQGYELLYQVSNEGRVKSLSRTNVSKNGRAYRINEKILKPSTHKDGHKQVVLCKNSERKTFKVHRLVLLAFVGPRPEGLYICHNDGIPSNNMLENLRYDTPASNQIDRWEHGTMTGSKEKSLNSLNEIKILEILNLKEKGLSQRKIASKIGGCRSTVGNFLKRKSWRHLEINTE